MKKLILLLGLFVLLFTLTGCDELLGLSGLSESDDTTIDDTYDITSEPPSTSETEKTSTTAAALTTTEATTVEETTTPKPTAAPTQPPTAAPTQPPAPPPTAAPTTKPKQKTTPKPKATDAPNPGKGVFNDKVASEILALVNAERAKVGAPALKWSNQFAVTAKIRVAEIPGSFNADHRRPDGTEWHTVLSEAGIKFSKAGENMANGGSSSQGAAWYTPEKVMESWMKSPGHKKNILSTDFKLLGVAAYDLDGKRYYVQHFGTLQ